MQIKRAIFWGMTALSISALIVLYFVDPMYCKWAPKCFFHQLTGWQCPGCGISRATHALLHGHFAEALAYNYFFVISVPYLLSVCVVSAMTKSALGKRLRLFVTGPVIAWSYVVLFCLWWVVRNIYYI